VVTGEAPTRCHSTEPGPFCRNCGAKI
jgi:hypothetical protein